MASKEDISTYIKEFKPFYQQEIYPLLASFEEERLSKKQTKDMLTKILTVCVIICVGSIVYFLVCKKMLIEPNNVILIFTFLSLFCLIPVCIFLTKLCKDFEIKVKEAVLNKYLSFFGHFSWSMQPKMTKEDIKESKLFPHFETIKTDDNFTGSFKGHRMFISEMELSRTETRYTNNGTRTEKVIIFEGVMVKIALNKKFSSQTIVLDREFSVAQLASQKLTGGGLDFLTKDLFYDFNKLHEVKLEDPDFCKKYIVYSEDQVEARFILTTAFIERFKLLRKAFVFGEDEKRIMENKLVNQYMSSGIKASFLNNVVTIAIPTITQRDLFLIGSLDKRMTDSEQINEFFKEFIAILSIVDILNLDSKTGL